VSGARQLRTVAVLGLVVLIWVFDRHYRFFDMVIYHDAIRWWRNGGELYDYLAPVRGELGFTYPPFAAFVLAPVSMVPAVTAGWLNAAGSVLALTAVLAVLLAPLADRHGWSRSSVVAVALPLALGTEPIRQTLGFGQVNLWLFALVVADLTVLRKQPWAGAGVGLAAAVKLTPALFIVYLLVTGQWRTARTATLTAAALTGCGFLLAPAESLRYFGALLWQTDRVGVASAVTNQSLSGLLARLAGTPAAPALGWVALSLLMLVIGLHRAGQAHRAGDEVTALTLVGLTANLISPMSWTHHLVFLPVAVLVLADSALRRRDPVAALTALLVYALSVVSPIWFSTAPLPRSTFTLLLIALVVALPWRAADRVPRDAGNGRPLAYGGVASGG
jgi:alpha-1,2-mannosyltransferase